MKEQNEDSNSCTKKGGEKKERNKISISLYLCVLLYDGIFTIL